MSSKLLVVLSCIAGFVFCLVSLPLVIGLSLPVVIFTVNYYYGENRGFVRIVTILTVLVGLFICWTTNIIVLNKWTTVLCSGGVMLYVISSLSTLTKGECVDWRQIPQSVGLIIIMMITGQQLLYHGGVFAGKTAMQPITKFEKLFDKGIDKLYPFSKVSDNGFNVFWDESIINHLTETEKVTFRSRMTDFARFLANDKRDRLFDRLVFGGKLVLKKGSPYMVNSNGNETSWNHGFFIPEYGESVISQKGSDFTRPEKISVVFGGWFTPKTTLTIKNSSFSVSIDENGKVSYSKFKWIK